MFLNIFKRLRPKKLKLKTFLSIFLLLIILVLCNFFLLISLKTYHNPTKLLQSIFMIHIHRNVTVLDRADYNGHQVDLHNSSKLTGGRAVNQINMVDMRRDGKLKVKTSKRVTETRHSEIKNITKSTMTSNDIIFKNKNSKTERSDNIKRLSSYNCTTWCYRGNGMKPPYLLTAVLLVRIYVHDLAKLSSREMIQWFQYLRYAGFQHIYVYDAYVQPSESQRDVIKPFVQSGFVTYIDWSRHNPYTIQGTQVAAYQDCIDKFGKESKWQAAIDIDEYPFSPQDTNENFMTRFLNEYSKNNPGVSEITMKNYLFLGKPIDDAIEPFLFARIKRRTHKNANPLVKPIYKPQAIGWAQVHHNGIKTGYSENSPEQLLRMNHYWGARLQNWGDDTPKVLDMTQPDNTIEPIVKSIKECAEVLGRDDLYVKRWA